MIGAPIGWPIGGVIVNDDIRLAADVGVLALTGVAAPLRVSASEAAASFVLAGQDVAFVGRLSAAVGGYALSGQAVTSKLNYTTVAGSYALAGPAAPLRVLRASDAGAFVFTGVVAPLILALRAKWQSYVVAWQEFSDASMLVANTGTFALVGNRADLSCDIDLGGIGGRITGGSFSRGRWREFQKEQRRAQEIAERAVERIERAARDAARKAAAENRAAIDAARRAEDVANAQAALLRAQVGAAQAGAGAQAITGAMNDAAAMQAMAREAGARQAVQRDEDEVIALLLLSV